jgi:hypothetical protein
MVGTIERLGKFIVSAGLTAVLLTSAPCGNKSLESATTQPAGQATATQRVEEKVSTTQNSTTKKLRFQRSSLTNSGKYKAIGLSVGYEGENDFFGVALTDLRSVDNAAPDRLNAIDPFSFGSMLESGTIPETVFYLTKEAAAEIKGSELEEELNGRINLKIPRRIASDAPKKETEVESVRYGNIGPLLSEEPPKVHYYFQKPSISSSKSVSASAKKIIERRESKSCPLPPIDQELTDYGNFSVKPIIETDSTRSRYTCAGIAVRFGGELSSCDLVGVVDLRKLEGSNPGKNPITGNDLRAMAFWGSAPFELLCTPEADGKISRGSYLRLRIGNEFSEELFSPPLRQPEVVIFNYKRKEALKSARLGELLPQQQNIKTLYFHAPRIFPCEMSEGNQTSSSRACDYIISSSPSWGQPSPCK